MINADRKTDEVRGMLRSPHPSVPADLAPRALALGTRLRRRRRITHRLAWVLLVTAAVALIVWLSVTDPWPGSPDRTTPRLQGR